QPPHGVSVQLREEQPNELGGLAGRFQGPAPLTRPEAVGQRIPRRSEELYVSALRLLRRARRPAEDPRGPHRREEDPVVARVARQDGPVHLVGGREWTVSHLRRNTRWGTATSRRGRRPEVYRPAASAVHREFDIESGSGGDRPRDHPAASGSGHDERASAPASSSVIRSTTKRGRGSRLTRRSPRPPRLRVILYRGSLRREPGRGAANPDPPETPLSTSRTACPGTAAAATGHPAARARACPPPCA